MKCFYRCLAPLTVASLLGACQGSEEQRAPADESTPDQLPPLSVVEPPLDREALLLEVMRSASDFAVGHEDQERWRELDGKPFALKLRFGCPGDSEARSWSFDESSRILRIRVEPEISANTPMIRALGSAEFESVEGFWIRRWWMLEPGCPVSPVPALAEGAEPAAAGDEGAIVQPLEATAAPRIGVAQFFTAEDSRVQRRNERAYETTVQLPEGQEPSREGYDLVLSGRLSPLPDGRVIACTGTPQAAPSCVIAAAIDEVEVTSPGGETIAEWSRS